MQQKSFNNLLLIVLIAGLGVTIGLQGYTLTTTTANNGTGTGDTVFLSISGSTTCFPIITECAEQFMDNYSNYDIRVSAGGSTTGVTNAGLGASDIGLSSRDIKSSEMLEWSTLVDWQFAADAISIIVDADATHGVTDLTLEQLFLIYNGTYTTWDAASQYGIPGLGGASQAIDVVTRAEGSGTRGSFEELVKMSGEQLGHNAGYIANVNSFHSEAENPLVASYVASHTGAIGYVGLGFVNIGHTLIPIDTVNPSEATVLDGSYPISRKLHMITNGMPNAGTMAFINYVFGPVGQEIAAAESFIPLYRPN